MTSLWLDFLRLEAEHAEPVDPAEMAFLRRLLWELFGEGSGDGEG